MPRSPELGVPRLLHAPDGAPASAEQHENVSLRGRVIVHTGGIRGIGKEVTGRLVKLGATVITPHRDPGKERRAERVKRSLADAGAQGKMVSKVCDLTDDAAVANFAREVQQEFGRVDVIIHNAAGGLEDWADNEYALRINATAKDNLTRVLAPLMKDREGEVEEEKDPRAREAEIMIIDITSGWGRFYGKVKQLPEYSRVARTKKEGERLLTKTVAELNNGRTSKIKRGEVCGHAILGTPTVDGMERRYPEEMAQVKTTAIDGEFPTIHQMADAIINMVVNGFEDGHVEWVGIPTLNRPQVEEKLPMYNPETTLHVDDAVLFSDEQIFAKRTVRASDAELHFTPENGQLMFYTTGEASLLITGGHTEGHFRPCQVDESGKAFELKVFRGVDSIAMGIEAAVINAQIDGIVPLGSTLTLARINGPVVFEEPIVPGDTIKTKPALTVQDGRLIANTPIAVDGIVATSIPSLEFVVDTQVFPLQEKTMTFPRMIEGGAQAVGLAFQHRKAIEKRETIKVLERKQEMGEGLSREERQRLARAKRIDPNKMAVLFRKIDGPIVFFRPVKVGETLEYDAKLAQGEEESITGDVIVRVGDEIVGIIPGIDCATAPSVKIVKRYVDGKVAQRRGGRS